VAETNYLFDETRTMRRRKEGGSSLKGHGKERGGKGKLKKKNGGKK